MPNTLAHIGVQGITTKAIFKFADLKWIYLGCLIPDLPWILQRVIKNSGFFNLYDVRDYSIIMASFLFCIILSGAVSFFSKNYKRVFLILVFSSLFHLLLDPLQIKWANGTHLLAPFDWHLLSFGFFWPESLPTYIITVLGFIYILWNYKKALTESSDLIFPRSWKIFISLSLSLVYFIAPLFMLNLPEQNNNHFVKTLRNYDSRTGKYIELDRANFIQDESANCLKTYAIEKIKAVNLNLSGVKIISIKGSFIAPDQIFVNEYHIHTDFRDDASLLGIFLVLILWLNIIYLQKRSAVIKPSD